MSVIRLFELAARMDRVGVTVTRVGLIVVLLWIGGLKAFRYEADGIVPFVANSPTMSFFYADPGNYKAHRNPEGALVPENRAWHERNRTYEFAYGLGTVIVLYGLLLCLHPWFPQAAAVGSFLVVVMSFVTLSVLMLYPILFVYIILRIHLALLSYSLILLTTVLLYVVACDPLPPCAGRIREWLSTAASSRPTEATSVVDGRARASGCELRVAR